MKEYAQDDASGKRFKKYESRLKNVFNIPNEINLEDDNQVKKLMMGITDVENPTLDKPDLNHNLYYFDHVLDIFVSAFNRPLVTTTFAAFSINSVIFFFHVFV